MEKAWAIELYAAGEEELLDGGRRAAQAHIEQERAKKSKARRAQESEEAGS